MIFPFQMFAQFPVTSQSGKLRESMSISPHLCLHKWFHSFLHSYQSPAFGEVKREKPSWKEKESRTGEKIPEHEGQRKIQGNKVKSTARAEESEPSDDQRI